jgi:hypothetical protein
MMSAGVPMSINFCPFQQGDPHLDDPPEGPEYDHEDAEIEHKERQRELKLERDNERW